MIGRVSIAVTWIVLLFAGGVEGSPGWKHVDVTRRYGAVIATLTFDENRISLGLLPAGEYRNMRLVVRRAGDVVIDSALPKAVQGVQTTVELTLRDVWGNAGPQAVVRASSCGNRCGERLLLGLVGPNGHGRLLLHDFGGGLAGPYAWGGQRRNGVFYFVASDQRFFCVFTDCASSTVPIQIFRVNSQGNRLVDVTRTRPDLVVVDAARLFAQYKSEIHYKQYDTKTRPGYDPMGVLGPWCADEYTLGRKNECHVTLAHAAANGYLTRWTPSALNSFYKQLSAWGYE